MNSDMTKYCYQHFENAYNIGWNVNFDSTVESKETFDSIFIEKLTLYCENPLNSDLNGVCRETEIDGKKYVKGFGEIRIIDLKKKIRYAAPNVIIDDILNGKYIPPIEFVDAVLTGPTFDSEEYQEFYLNYSEKNFWGENEENLKKIVKVLELAGDFEGFKDYILNINEESQGTQKLFKLLCPFIDVLVNGKVLFYDELEASLHPALVDELIHTFKNWKSEKNPQLIFSSHDTSLLDLDLFRRDQIWFAERNPGLCTTEYYSLVELKNVRKDDNIKKGYINGRYSTIPLKGSSLIEVLGGE